MNTNTQIIDKQQQIIDSLKSIIEITKKRNEIMAGQLDRAVKLIEMKNGDTYFIGLGYITSVAKNLREG